MKKEIKENKTTKMVNEIRGILDNDYFHINAGLNQKYTGGIEWTVYYKNLITDDYFSDKNKPLLTSKHNTIADIYILKDIFDKLKQQIEEAGGFELFRDNKKLYWLIKVIKENAYLGIINIFSIYVFVNLIIILISKNYIASFINFATCIIIAIYIIFKNKKMNKLIDEAELLKKKILLKNLIKGQGLLFVKKLRKELYSKGVYKYGTNKETRKTIE